jgi:hypothetical protein
MTNKDGWTDSDFTALVNKFCVDLTTSCIKYSTYLDASLSVCRFETSTDPDIYPMHKSMDFSVWVVH